MKPTPKQVEAPTLPRWPITKREVLAILEGKCPYLRFTEAPSALCTSSKKKCTQINCPVRTEAIADELVKYLEGRR